MRFDQSWFNSPGFSWQKAYGLALACELAYRTPQEISTILDQDWRMGGKVFDIGDTEGFVAVGPKAAIVSFRGTQGASDWFNVNLAASSKEFAPIAGKAHGGFISGWKTVSDLVLDVLETAGNRTIWFTGHSLGAAIAILGAAERAQTAVPDVITFGQPRIFDRDAAKSVATIFGSKYHRVVNGDDIVARIPKAYRHSGRLHHVGGDPSALSMVANALDAMTSSENDGPSPVADEEYQAIAKALAGASEADANMPMAGAAGALGNIGGKAVEDHRVGAYVDITRQLGF